VRDGGGSAFKHCSQCFDTQASGIQVNKGFRTRHVVGVHVCVDHVFQRQAQLLHQLRVSVNSVKLQESLVVGAESD
jgi:hypothetical protein